MREIAPAGDPSRLNDTDRRFLDAAFRLGRSAQGTTFPNPAVGAIIVRQGKVIGRARTGRSGRPHAESMALESAGAAARGASLYVSLEPCAHHGKTPPCTDAIIAAGISRVVAGMRDPDPRVDGMGLMALAHAGVAVVAPTAPANGRLDYAGHRRRMGEGRPHVVLKLAVSADDLIGRHGDGMVQVTGKIARRHVQALRSRFDAVMIGAGTANADNPQLTCRLPGLEHRSPVRIVISGATGLRDDLALLSADAPPPVWIVGCGEPADPIASGDGDRERRWITVPGEDGRVDLAAALRALGKMGLTKVLVEGGARLARSLLEADLVDEAILFRNPVAIGAGGVAALAGADLSLIEAEGRFVAIDRRRFGDDRRTRYVRAG